MYYLYVLFYVLLLCVTFICYVYVLPYYVTFISYLYVLHLCVTFMCELYAAEAFVFKHKYKCYPYYCFSVLGS